MTEKHSYTPGEAISLNMIYVLRNGDYLIVMWTLHLEYCSERSCLQLPLQNPQAGVCNYAQHVTCREENSQGISSQESHHLPSTYKWERHVYVCVYARVVSTAKQLDQSGRNLICGLNVLGVSVINHIWVWQ